MLFFCLSKLARIIRANSNSPWWLAPLELRLARGLLKTAAQQLLHRQDFCALEGEEVGFLVLSNFKGQPRKFLFFDSKK